MMRVKVKRMGWFEGRRCREGEIISLSDQKQFSKEWMEKVVDDPAPKKSEVAPEPKGKGKATGDKDVI